MRETPAQHAFYARLPAHIQRAYEREGTAILRAPLYGGPPHKPKRIALRKWAKRLVMPFDQKRAELDELLDALRR